MRVDGFGLMREILVSGRQSATGRRRELVPMPANESHLVLLEDTHSWISQSSIQGRPSVRFKDSLDFFNRFVIAQRRRVAYRILI